MIERPFTLANIPKDLTGSSGRVAASDVHAILGPKKKKRSELALGIDRQGVNIYNVQTSKLVTSYAISPEATFTCPPCSVRYRGRGVETSRRYTYCSLKLPKPKLLCFSESSNEKTSPSEHIKTSSLDLDANSRPIIQLDTFQVRDETADGAPENKLLAVHEDGTVSCFSKDLGIQEWSTHFIHSSSDKNSVSTVIVEHAAILSAQQARKTLLKNRSDMLATLSATPEGLGGSLLLIIARARIKNDPSGRTDLMLRIFTIKAIISDANAFSGSARQRLHELTSTSLPEPNSLSSKASQFTYYPRFGSLHQNAEGSVALYDLHGSTPRLVRELSLGETTCSRLQLSPNLLAYSNRGSLSIIDLPYCSLQAERNMTETVGATALPQEAQSNKYQLVSLHLLSYFAPLDVVVATEGRKLVAVQLSTSSLQPGGSRKRKRGACLIDSVGRKSSLATGISVDQKVSDHKVKALGSYLPSSSARSEWSHQKAELDRYCSQSNTRRFDQTAARALGLESKEGDKSELLSVHPSVIDHRKVRYLLDKIFSVEKGQEYGRESQTETPMTLKTRFLPRKTCGWLIEKGLFTTAHVENSLKHQGSLRFTSTLATGALVHAIVKSDPTLDLLLSMLASRHPLSSGELIHVLMIGTLGAERLGVTEEGNLLPNGDSVDGVNDGDRNKSRLTNGEVKGQSNSAPLAAHANEKNRHRILNLTLKRLYACSSSSIARTLKQDLSTTQLRILVDALRIQVARSGWLSSYIDSLEPLDPDLQDNNQLGYIAHLLNCIIDSIGTGGWIVGTTMTDDLNETAETISYMRAEISAALEGIEEATYLKGMLGEMLLCGKTALHSSAKPSKSDQAQLAAIQPKPITISLSEGQPAMLPLGLKTAPAISQTRIGAGGEVMKRSARDIGRLKSRMVGKYSFEQILV